MGNAKKKHQAILTPRQSEKNLSISEISKTLKGEKNTKFIPKIGNLGTFLKIKSFIYYLKWKI